ncbi:hypothetical protein MLD38_038588 [Melastoma candidum]|uniref:Uncharacterized protein n=1 Tax=Melastoma candidum TaxID=119954 RepID=A0ACB9KZL3_9MYRT|nr:hypothetical protein MLD38_038588 [Melastoma candidum]
MFRGIRENVFSSSVASRNVLPFVTSLAAQCRRMHIEADIPVSIAKILTNRSRPHQSRTQSIRIALS